MPKELIVRSVIMLFAAGGLTFLLLLMLIYWSLGEKGIMIFVLFGAGFVNGIAFYPILYRIVSGYLMKGKTYDFVNL